MMAGEKVLMFFFSPKKSEMRLGRWCSMILFFTRVLFVSQDKNIISTRENFGRIGETDRNPTWQSYTESYLEKVVQSMGLTQLATLFVVLQSDTDLEIFNTSSHVKTHIFMNVVASFM